LSLAWGLSVLLLLWASLQEYDLVFDKFYKQYALSAWNTSEMGTVIHDFAQTIGSPDTAWVMGFPYWVDTRLVALNAGYPSRDFAMFVDQLPATTQKPGPKLFIIKPEDQAAIDALKMTYPQGWLHTYSSKVETKDFLIYYVPPQ
jgi:hypothetical protein